MAGLGGSSCFNPAGHVILKGLGGRPGSVIIGGFHLHIRNKQVQTGQRPGGSGGAAANIPAPAPNVQPQYYDQPEHDPNIVDLHITVKWPLIDKKKTLQFTMERKWANMVVNRINQINTFNGRFKVRIGEFKDDFVTKYSKKK